MNPILQWAIPIIVGILTFFAGRSFERHKQAQANRLGLLAPIEEWVNVASRLVSIIGDDISSFASGFQVPVTYSPNERAETAKAMSESKEKVVGIIKSEALTTRSTKRISMKLSNLVNELSVEIEQGYLQTDVRLFDKVSRGDDPTPEITSLLAATPKIKAHIEDIHSCLSQLKVRFT